MSNPRISLSGANTPPLGDDELAAVRSIPGLAAVVVQPNHRMSGQYPTGVTYLFEPTARVPKGLFDANIESRTALYAMRSTDGSAVPNYRGAMLKLQQGGFAATAPYKLSQVGVALGRDQLVWDEHYELSRNTAAFVRIEDPHVPDGRICLLLDTDGGPAAAELLATIEQSDGAMTMDALLRTSVWTNLQLLADRNSKRLAVRLMSEAGAQPLNVGEDILASPDYDPVSHSSALPPPIAIPDYMTKHDGLSRVNNGTLIAYDRGTARVDQNQPALVQMTDPFNVAALYTLQPSARLTYRGAVAPLGARLASPQQQQFQAELAVGNTNVRQHINNNVLWANKMPNTVHPSLHLLERMDQRYPAFVADQLLGGRFQPVGLKPIVSVIPGGASAAPGMPPNPFATPGAV
jgi:hypothetical protein